MNIDLLFRTISQVHPTLIGWCDIDKAHTLAAAIVTHRPAIVVEIGVFGGKSLIPMALACRALGKGVVLGIDPWAQAASVEGQDEANRNWWATCDHERVLQDFTRHIAELNLTNFVSVMRCKSDDAVPPDRIGLLHVDGNHGQQAERDMRRFAPKVEVGGLVVIDDIGWTGGGVSAGVEYLKTTGFRDLYPLGTGAMFQRVA